jgi:glycerol-3-phosphate dehydrogenase (NAD(P)+)
MNSGGKIAILGAGAWGTALAQLYTAEKSVVLWCHRTEQAEKISRARENADYLPGVKLNPNINVTTDSKFITDAEIILVAVPTQHLPATLQALKGDLSADAGLVICAKGIHLETGLLLPDAVKNILPTNPIAILSGPNLAHEIARGLPAAATIAAANQHLADDLAKQLQTKTFRPYASTDITGVALAGALKNVIALAAGMVMGAGLGENARAAIVTRGVAEIARLGAAMGARAETFMGLSGIGDMMLTCHAATSRNFSCGFALGQGKTLAEILAARKSVTEGVATVAPALELAANHGVELPICQVVANVLENKINIAAALQQLMKRPLKAE